MAVGRSADWGKREPWGHVDGPSAAGNRKFKVLQICPILNFPQRTGAGAGTGGDGLFYFIFSEI